MIWCPIAVEEFGRIDILVTNAGSRPGADRVPVVDLREDAWETVHRTSTSEAHSSVVEPLPVTWWRVSPEER